MNSEILVPEPESEVKLLPFPKLMICNDNKIIIMFETEDCGMIVNSKETENPVGFYSESWDPRQFREFEGQIIIGNKTK